MSAIAIAVAVGVETDLSPDAAGPAASGGAEADRDMGKTI
jgi:hypothetical protein